MVSVSITVENLTEHRSRSRSTFNGPTMPPREIERGPDRTGHRRATTQRPRQKSRSAHTLIEEFVKANTPRGHAPRARRQRPAALGGGVERLLQRDRCGRCRYEAKARRRIHAKVSCRARSIPIRSEETQRRDDVRTTERRSSPSRPAADATRCAPTSAPSKAKLLNELRTTSQFPPIYDMTLVAHQRAVRLSARFSG